MFYKVSFRVSLGSTRYIRGDVHRLRQTHARAGTRGRERFFRREQRGGAARERRDRAGGRIFRDSGEWAKNCVLRRTGGNMGAHDRKGKRGL